MDEEYSVQHNFCSTKTQALDTEFRYYSLLLRNLFPSIKYQRHKEIIITWIKKLHNPECAVTIIREKRNRFMLMLCMTLLTDELGFFKQEAPSVLPELSQMNIEKIPLAEWENDNSWEDILKEKELAEKFHTFIGKSKNQKCIIHAGGACPINNELDLYIGKTLDKQFKFYLHIGKPYAALLKHSSDRILASKWLQTLCTINKNCCAVSKGIRNDYMMSLLGYLANKSLCGPFKDYPMQILPPLCQLAQINAEKRPITDPTHPRIEQFMIDLPHPENGAFAFISLTGDLYEK